MTLSNVWLSLSTPLLLTTMHARWEMGTPEIMYNSINPWYNILPWFKPREICFLWSKKDGISRYILEKYWYLQIFFGPREALFILWYVLAFAIYQTLIILHRISKILKSQNNSVTHILGLNRSGNHYFRISLGVSSSSCNTLWVRFFNPYDRFVLRVTSSRVVLREGPSVSCG